MERDKLAVINFGGQYVRLIARKIRELGVYCEIVDPENAYGLCSSPRVKGIILSGGPDSVQEEGAPVLDQSFFDLGKPVLGICYGMQLMAEILPGGSIEDGSLSEYGRAEVKITDTDILFEGIFERGEVFTAWMSHGDSVVEEPEDFEILAETASAPIVAMADRQKNLYGVQFHPEVTHTERGSDILANFIFDICGLEENWQISDIVQDRVEQIKSALDDDANVLIGLSGGVDSSVAAALIQEAVGDRLTGIFIDHGLLRQGEAEQVKKSFSQVFEFPIKFIDASQRFLGQLEGVSDPEEKRNIIGREFIKVFEQEAEDLENVTHLAQGTIYSDVIESGLDQNAALIKSHHNVGGLPERMELNLLEPLREFFKDEVRRIGEELGLPEDVVWRQPFPGPGLAIRVIGEVTREKLALLRKADYIFREELENSGISDKVWQSFAVLPDMKSVGVMGDTRTYGYPIILRAVDSEEAMTADWVKIPHELLDKIAGRIVNEMEQVNRVVYDVSSKPPATIEWE